MYYLSCSASHCDGHQIIDSMANTKVVFELDCGWSAASFVLLHCGWWAASFVSLHCGWSAVSYVFWPPCGHFQAVFFFVQGCKRRWPVCASGEWDFNLHMNLHVICHIRFKGLKKTRVFFEDDASWIDVCGNVWNRGDTSFKSRGICVFNICGSEHHAL